MTTPLYSGPCRFCNSTDIRLESTTHAHWVVCNVCHAAGPRREDTEQAVFAYFANDPLAQANSDLRAQCGGMAMTINELTEKLNEREDAGAVLHVLSRTSLERTQDFLVLHKADLIDADGSQHDIMLIDETLDVIRRALAVYP